MKHVQSSLSVSRMGELPARLSQRAAPSPRRVGPGLTECGIRPHHADRIRSCSAASCCASRGSAFSITLHCVDQQQSAMDSWIQITSATASQLAFSSWLSELARRCSPMALRLQSSVAPAVGSTVSQSSGVAQPCSVSSANMMVAWPSAANSVQSFRIHRTGMRRWVSRALPLVKTVSSVSD